MVFDDLHFNGRGEECRFSLEHSGRDLPESSRKFSIMMRRLKFCCDHTHLSSILNVAELLNDESLFL